MHTSSSPTPLPSLDLPPSPSSEGPHELSPVDNDGDLTSQVIGKGKGRQYTDSTGDHSDEALQTAEGGTYPPISEEEAETRRVEENLRRWELAERQRRKAARESHTASSSSFLSNITKRASLLLSGDLPQPVHRNTHDSLNTHGSDVPLTQVSSGPFPDDIQPVHAPSDPFADDPGPQSSTKDGQKGARIPRPAPLGLPPPKTPPPIHAPPLMAPLPIGADDDPPNEEQEVRWWHEWLCGCGEGRDRGGDNQAGRTNPFE
ncbi:hypothetical protein BDN72DRAFT_832129 [Pluteus cervinus]|uniref:Uncharacterized protein n=1 Tax=Pluteus cervinus TaxID=181527 RepID=A0ACD3BC37_9AGAR|nr:hypothetical protein BDN72DRAFT_832129 [Pluteus cervinus]